MSAELDELLGRIDAATAEGRRAVEIALPRDKLARKTARNIVRQRIALAKHVREAFSTELRLDRLRKLQTAARRRLRRRLWILRLQILGAWIWLLLVRTWLYLAGLLLLLALVGGLYFAATRLLPDFLDLFRPGAAAPPASGAQVQQPPAAPAQPTGANP